MKTSTFVELYYPNYFDCETIARLNDLYVILDNEVAPGSNAEAILNLEFDGEINNNRARLLKYIAHLEAHVFKLAIENFK
jgi:hypothetical protein